MIVAGVGASQSASQPANSQLSTPTPIPIFDRANTTPPAMQDTLAGVVRVNCTITYSVRNIERHCESNLGGYKVGSSSLACADKDEPGGTWTRLRVDECIDVASVEFIKSGNTAAITTMGIKGILALRDKVVMPVEKRHPLHFLILQR